MQTGIEWKFKWFWCYLCDSAAIKCPKCDNNCCNATYGPAKGTIHDKDWDPSDPNKCPVCPLVYEYADLAYQTKTHPTKEQLDKAT